MGRAGAQLAQPGRSDTYNHRWLADAEMHNARRDAQCSQRCTDMQSNMEPNPKTTKGKGRLQSQTFWIELCMEDSQKTHPCHTHAILKLVGLLPEGEFRLNHVKAHI